MKKLQVLTLLVRIIFICLVVCVIFAVPFFLILLIAPGRVPFEVNGIAAKDFAAEDFCLLAAQIVGLVFYAYATYLFKEALLHFRKKHLFREKCIKLLDDSGKAILLGFAVMFVSQFLYNTIVKGEFILGIDVSDIFIVVTGLFLMVLAEVFVVSKTTEDSDENI